MRKGPMPESTEFARVPNEKVRDTRDRAAEERREHGGGSSIMNYQEKLAREKRDAQNSRS